MHAEISVEAYTQVNTTTVEPRYKEVGYNKTLL